MPQSVSEPSETAAAASFSEIQREKSQGVTDGEADSSEAPPPRDAVAQTAAIGVNLQPGESVVQQDIVDMYMKSMQQFTESLGRMNLPMELDGGTGVVVQTEEKKPEAEAKKDGARVFYGSRAFF
jgi:hypothetical protein